MTDGNTGFHVAPITEDDMSRVHSILKRAADAIVGMSQLQADVDMLRQTVASLQSDADRLRSQNNALDEALNHSRQVRDEQGRKLAETEQALTHANTERDQANDEAHRLALDNGTLTTDLEAARKAKDDAEFRVLELEDKLTTANARIAQATKHISDMASLFRPDEPEAKLESPKAEPPTEPFYAAHPEPAPAHSGPDSQDHWDPGYVWDTATGKYWREGVTPKADGEAIPF